jgi:hypothetical protein
MSVDRHNHPIRIGYSAVELIYIAAAASLPLRERESAYSDIAQMTSRRLSAVRTRGALILAQERQKAREWLSAHLHKNWLSEAATAPPRRVYVVCPTISSPARVSPAGK